GSAASQVLHPGDRIVGIEGHSLAGLSGNERIERLSAVVSSHKCAGVQTDGCRAETPVQLTVRRGAALKTFEVTPEYDAGEKRMLVGIQWAEDSHWIPISTSLAATRSVDAMSEVVSRTASVFAHIFESKQRGEISGIVGTSDVGHQAVEAGWRKALLLLALVSLSLGLINLLPILPLDGGHIFWAIVEKMRGEAVSLRVMERASIIGFALVAMLFVLGLSNDIGRITGEGFNVR
ncbi:MAG TPA: site-2 protease family protein, partial [Fimbriimonadaceae bacterium]|nr:site-2 protease family protein [Fimbriimonadaceae bacterium]